MIRLQTVISYADFCLLSVDENCQMRWQKKELFLLKAGCGYIICPAVGIRVPTGLCPSAAIAHSLGR